MTMFRLASSEFLDFELLRILTTAPFGGCDVAEFLEAASRASRGPKRWHAAWHAAGETAEGIAAEAGAVGDGHSASRARLRAANYFRASQYMMFRDELPRITPIYERSVANFDAALRLLVGSGACLAERVEIPYTDDTGGSGSGSRSRFRLPGILYVPAEANRLPAPPSTANSTGPNRVPVLLNTCGADSSQEEHYFCYPVAGAQLGYAVLTFEGPGQGLVLRRDGLPFRPDWERVTSAALDFLSDHAASHPELELDTSRVALAGASMGGYLALRGAADVRVAACVSVDPFYSLWDFVAARLPGPLVALWTNGWLPDAMLDAMAAMGRYLSNFQTRWEFDMSKWMFGVETPTEMFRRTMLFTLAGSGPTGGGAVEREPYLHRIKCPTLITGAGKSLYFDPEKSTHRIYCELVNVRPEDKELWVPHEPSLGGLQAKIGAFGMAQMKTFAFLDNKFGIHRQSLAPTL